MRIVTKKYLGCGHSAYHFIKCFGDGSTSLPIEKAIINRSKQAQLKLSLQNLENDLERGRRIRTKNSHLEKGLQSRATDRKPLMIEAQDCSRFCVGLPLNNSQEGVCSIRRRVKPRVGVGSP